MHIIDVPGPGGAESVCLQLAAGVDPARWRSIVVVPGEGWIHSELVRAGVEVAIVPCRGLREVPRYLTALTRLIRKHDVRLLHGHLLGPGVVASILGLVLGLPVVCTLHGQVDLNPRERFKRAKAALLARGVTRMVFVSRSLRDFFLRTGMVDARRARVIPNGVDATRFDGMQSTSLRAAFGAPNGQFLVGAVGNVRPAKSYDTLLHAAALLAPRAPELRFVIAGDADSALGQRMLLLRDELGLRDVVTFAGFIADVPGVMASVDVYALTSSSEGFSISTTEAMAAGKPIVATRCGGPEEILEDGVTGLLVENGSAEAVASAIDSLRVNPAMREALGRAAKREVGRRFSLAAHVRSYERLYDECLGGAAAAGADS